MSVCNSIRLMVKWFFRISVMFPLAVLFTPLFYAIVFIGSGRADCQSAHAEASGIIKDIFADLFG